MRWIHLLRSSCAMAALFIASSVLASGAPATEQWLAVSHHLSVTDSAVDFTRHGTQPGLSYDLAETNQCSGCHGGGSAPSSTFRPYPTWAGSMMANAARDPLFFAALDIANKDAPGVGDYCLRCHTSRGWYRGHVVKAGFGQPDNSVTLGASACLLTGGYDWEDNLDNDYSGVPCHYCHRLSDTGPGGEPAMIGNADAWVDDQACDASAGEPCRRGPYGYPTGSVPPHPWQQSAYQTQGRLCGLCHDVTSPDAGSGPLKTLKLANGTDTGHAFPIERTYSEWNQSLFADLIFRDGFDDLPADVPALARAEQCQSCHMPTSEDPSATACSLIGYPNRTGNLPVHSFVGGNTWVPGIIKGEFGDTSSIPGAYGGVGRQNSFDQTVTWTRQMLGNAASMRATIQSFTPPTGSAGSMAVRVKVTNLSGHKLPTGYSEGRRMWVNLQVHDANGALVFESGAYNAAGATLTLDPQVRVYEVQQGIFNANGTGICDIENGSGNAMFHFVLNDCVAKDNRIPPLGFKPATAADPNGYDLRPVGAIYPETTPGSGILVNYDTVDYSVPVPVGAVAPLTVNARLYYQLSSKDYIAFLRDEAVANATAGENQLCMSASNRPFVVGPQGRTRGEYMYELWNNAANNPIQPGYGKSPPELMQNASATTP